MTAARGEEQGTERRLGAAALREPVFRVVDGNRSARALLGWSWGILARFAARPRFTGWLVLLALLLASSSLFLGFYLDDWIGRYIYSDLPGADRLYRNYSGGYGLAIGDLAENRWQMEAGWAPWWHYEQLRLAMYRPIGIALHAIDFALWPDHPLPMRLQNMLWLAAMVAATTVMYRAVLGAAVGGAAALLFAIDHTHGYAIGHICNRHALIGVTFGALCLHAHFRFRSQGKLRDALLGPAFYLLGLLSSESTIAVCAYLFAFALCADGGGMRARLVSVLPYAFITAIWRSLYNAAGFGAVGSGVYIDIGREPLSFATNFLERGPLLWLGQFLTPPAEIYIELSKETSHLMLAWAFVVLGLSLAVFWPLLARDRMARFWILGLVGALVPAGATHPHNRQLVFASIGAMALIAQLWHFYVHEPPASTGARVVRTFGCALIGFHLVWSPFGLPMTSASIGVTAPVHRAAEAVGKDAGGRDLIFVTTPEYYTVRLAMFMKHLAGEHLPKRVRAISGEPAPIRVRRSGERTLEVTYEDGLLGSRMGDDLHRDRRLGMPASTTVDLSGFHVEVLRTTADGRPQLVRFTFDVPLEDPSLVFYRWDDDHFVHFLPPGLGQEVRLPGAKAPLSF